MKALQKQIKLTNITKYIKKNDMRWLCLVIPLFIGLILHFVVPITFVLNGNPAAQSTYNHQKLRLEQQTVRSVSILNSEIIRAKIQKFENMRNFLIRIFGQPNGYQKIIPTQIALNNAYQITQLVNNGTGISNISDRSMWFAQGKSTFDQLNDVQKYVYLEYLAVEPFVQSEFVNVNNSTQQTTLKGMSLSANYLGQDIHFAYPSKFNSNFSSLDNSSFDKYYNLTMYNYQNSNTSYDYMIFSEPINGSNQIIPCNVIFSNQSPVGVACFYIMLSDIAFELTSNLGIPNISYSSTSYYLLTPIYPSFQMQNNFQPQIIFNFTDKDPTKIDFPNNNFFQLPSSMTKNLYIPVSGQKTMRYLFYVTFDAGRSIYFQVPIYIYSYQQVKVTVLFLLIKYNFEGSAFNSIAKYSDIMKDLSIPSFIVIIVSTLISLLVLKFLLNSLDGELFKVNSNCEFLLHGDLDLKIPEYENTEELQSVYKHLRIVNCLHKFSTPSYFHDPSQRKIIKLFKVIQIFDQLKYPKDIVLENIADSYLMIGQILKAIDFLTQSYDLLVKQIEEVFEEKLNDILILKHKENKKLCRRYRRYELKLIARLFKLILMYSFLMVPASQITFDKNKFTSNLQQNKLPSNFFDESEKKLRKYLQIFKKLAYPNFVTSQTVFAYLFEARFQIMKKNFKAAKTIFKRFQKIMAQYGNQFQNVEPNSKDDSPIKSYQQMKNNLSSYCRISPTIMWSAYNFIHGIYLSQHSESQSISQTVDSFRKAVEGNTFTEDIHLRVIAQMIRISYDYELDENKVKRLISSFTFFKQTFPLYHLKESSQTQKFKQLSHIRKGLQREVIFLFDCSNKWITKLDQFRKWQKQTRQLAVKVFGFLQPEDRVSILKVNSTLQVSTGCNLIYKRGNESLITKQLNDAIKIKIMSGRCRVIEGIKTAIHRIKMLEEEKYILLFVKESKEPQLSSRTKPQKKQKKMSQSSSMMLGKFKSHNFTGLTKGRKNTQVSPYHKQTIHSKDDSNLNSFEEEQFGDTSLSSFCDYYKNLRQQVLYVLLAPDIFNLRLIFISSNAQSFKRRFNMSDVNRTVQKQLMKRHRNHNNQVFVFDYQNLEDFERVFKKKTIQRQFQNVLYMF